MRDSFHTLQRLMLVFFLTIFLAACGSTEYWIPPSSGVHSGSTPPAVSGEETGQATTTQVSDLGINSDQATPIPSDDMPGSDIPTATQTPPMDGPASDAPILYYAQAADTLPAVAVRYGVKPEEITSNEPIPSADFLKPGMLLIIPYRDLQTSDSRQIIPDSEVVYSPSTTDFNTQVFVEAAGGKLSTFKEWHKSTGFTSGAEIVERVATENSINPRLLLALLEYESGWVYGQPATETAEKYPMGWVEPFEDGLYNQLVWGINQLSIGYYAWREGRLTEISLVDGSSLRLAPDTNAGTAALMYYFAQQNSADSLRAVVDLQNGFPALHNRMFGDAWQRSKSVEPLFPPGIRQPPLTLPFQRDWTWSYTGGPHGAWEREGAYAALDFAPGSSESGCVRSLSWVEAASSGLVVRSGKGVVVLDLDGDGREQTGWVVVYLHVSSEDRIPVGSWVGAGDQLGHASCEGGISTGTHLHIARKYNGEWIPAAGPLPFNLGGWVAQAGEKAYEGTLTRGDITLKACPCSSANTFVRRGPDDP